MALEAIPRTIRRQTAHHRPYLGREHDQARHHELLEASGHRCAVCGDKPPVLVGWYRDQKTAQAAVCISCVRHLNQELTQVEKSLAEAEAKAAQLRAVVAHLRDE